MLLNIEAKEINGYKIFDILDDGTYVAKSKEDLMEYVRKYGNVEEVYGVTEQELLMKLRKSLYLQIKLLLLKIGITITINVFMIFIRMLQKTIVVQKLS